MIGNSLLDYVNIRIGIGALRLVAPASIAYLVICGIAPQSLKIPWAIFAAAEASFYLLAFLPRKRCLQAPPAHPPPSLSRDERHHIFIKCVAAGKTHPSSEAPYPTGWFLPQDSTPKREDAVDWLLWALFSTTRDEAPMEEYQAEIDGYIEEIEKLLGKSLEHGHSKDEGVRSMRITLDPVVMLHRPLVWYCIVALVDSYTSVALALLGFKHYSPLESQWSQSFPPRPILWLLSRRAPEGVVTPYWCRPHKSPTKLPLVFLHGIGIGLYPYIPFFRSIISGDDANVGILLPELLPISMHMTRNAVPPRSRMLASLNIILESLRIEEEKTRQFHPEHDDAECQPLLSGNGSKTTGWNSVVFSAHSYGTFVAGWIVRDCVEEELISHSDIPHHSTTLASKIAHLVLVDPIPILLSNPAVAHNFLYRDPSTVCPRTLRGLQHADLQDLPASPSPKAWYSSAAAWQLWYFASRDADVARTLCRAFFWSEGGIWREEVDAFMRGVKAGASSQPQDGDVSSSEQSRRVERNVAVVLGGVDQIVPAEAIRRHLTGEERWRERWVGSADVREEEEGAGLVSGVQVGQEHKQGVLEVLFNPRLDHAKIFDVVADSEPLVDVVRRYVRAVR
ncbi:hypothetical protein B0H34DRAFT_697014 [Crassisporium funariophilum]|nr:hypothetical protein B0H34DRAFT_697014 [Crassisporium funariophilum]